MRLQVIRSNPFVRNFYEKMQELDRVIRLCLETLQEWQTFQRKWIYLEEIFALPEIRKQLEKEAKRFKSTIDAYFRACTKGFEIAFRVHIGVQREVALTTLNRMIRDCEEIGRGLGDFLEFKREQFPRLYFLSNEEIVDIFGMEKLIEASKRSKDQPPIRTFITNLFEGVELIHFEQG